MKKILIGLLALLFASCSLSDFYTPPSLGEYGVPTLSSGGEIIDWIDNNIEYCKDEELYGYTEYYASIEEIMANRKGDCEDFANLFLVMMKQNLGIEGKFLIYENESTDIAHALAVAGGYRYYDVDGYTILVKEYSYETAMLRIGTKWGKDGTRPKGIMKETGI